VVDLIQEEFRIETVPHAMWLDRRQLLNRKRAQLFRTTPYHQAQVQGREKSGRKDDRVLFSALTSSESLSPWLDRILAQKAPLAGITSVPLLSESQAARHLPGDHPQLLLVSHQSHSGLRQNYLRNGRLQFSRLTDYVPAPAPGQTDLLPGTMIEECLRTRQYLERQRFISPQEALEILVLAEPGEYGRLRQIAAESPLLRFGVHDLASTAAGLGIRAEPDLGVASLSLVQARPAGGLPNHYAPEILLRYQRISQFRHALVAGCTMLVLASFYAAFILVADGILDLNNHQLQVQATRRWQAKYEEQRLNLPTVPIPVESLKKAVQAMDTLSHIPSPILMMSQVSRALDACPEIQPRRFSWSVIATAEAVPPGGVGTPGAPTAGSTAPSTLATLLPAMAVGKTEVTARLDGTIHPFGGPRAIHDSLQRFITTLATNSGLTATLLEVPMETRPDKSISTKLGGEQTDPGFSLRLSSQVSP
jgi:hypothetical protein